MFQQFPKISTDSYPEKLKKLLDSQRKKISSIADTDSPTYGNTLKYIQDMDEELGLFFTPLSHINSTINTEQTQKAYEESISLLSIFQSEFTQNEALFETIKRIEPKSSSEKMVTEHLLRDFRLAGAELSMEEKARMEQIDLELSELSSDFSKNLLESTNSFEMLLDNPADVEGLPESDLESAKVEVDGQIYYKFTLQAPSYISYMTYGPNREKRESLYHAYTTRAPENKEIVDRILALRSEKSKLLNYGNYADYALQTRDAEGADDIFGLLDDLIDTASPFAKRDIEELGVFAREIDGIKLLPHDVGYYSEKLKMIKFGYDDNVAKPYFEQIHVLNEMLAIISELFDVEITQVDAATWHDSVKVYEILEDSESIARIYFDLDARKEKRGGAWMHNWETRFIDSNGTLHLPSAFVVTNFAPANKNTPSLLRHDDVVTLFHEMGHAIHHLFSKQEERSISGINGVSWDVVEFPSQFLENFAFETTVLKRLGAHYKTGATIPEEIINKIQNAKNFQAAMGILRQVEFALFDFMLHRKLYQGDEIQNLLNNIRKRTSLLKLPSYNKFQHGFSHIFSGGYAAGYYSYKWAEVFSADALLFCLDSSQQFIPDRAKGYKNNILSKGASKPMRELYHEWIGSYPSAKSLALLYGMNAPKE